MKQIDIQLSFVAYDSFSELKKGDLFLMEKAKAASEVAYAPYSHFKAGCAVLLDNGEIVIGSNQENASSNACLCAEDIAISVAGAQFPDAQIMKMAVYVINPRKTTGMPMAPSGITRQRILEYEMRHRKSITLLCAGESGVVYEFGSIKELLPLGFSFSDVV